MGGNKTVPGGAVAFFWIRNRKTHLREMKRIQSRVVKADFLKAVRKAVPKRLIRLLKGCYI